jgi:hypothetical protein
VDVAVQKKFSKGTNEEIDPLVDLVEKIADEFRLKRLVSFQAARCVKAEHAVLYSSEHWEQLRQFTSLLTLSVWADFSPSAQNSPESQSLLTLGL